jgi:pyrophosphate--fructose-6-phosphate 1-phosphotransferase
MSALTLTCSKLIFMVDYLKQSEFVYALLPIYCFCTVTGGTDGLFAQKTLEISDEVLSSYKNQGGYDLLGRTRDQIRTTEQVNAAMTACQALKLDALVIIGGVTSNTDAAQLAETFAESKCSTKVVGVPVTLNGDLKNQFVETTVGFDTICKVYMCKDQRV